MQATSQHLVDVPPALPPGHAVTRYFGFVTVGVLPIALVADWFVPVLDTRDALHTDRGQILCACCVNSWFCRRRERRRRRGWVQG